jgi:hypothetical protein
MGDIKKLRDKVALIKSIPYKTKWDDIYEGDVLHIPKLLSIQRKDVVVVKKTDDTVTYKVVGKEGNKTFSRTSIYAHLITKKLTF